MPIYGRKRIKRKKKKKINPKELKKSEWADINFKVTANNRFKKIDYKMENFIR